jgi:Eco57I restriction endonuclease.
MKFDFAIGNPPYQDESIGENKTFQPPVYDKFMDAAYQVAQKVELIHPAKFLFNAGGTPKKWNEKMLNDEHFKILDYQEDATKVFPTTEIKSGVVISYRDESSDYGAIGVYVKQRELNDILHKVSNSPNFSSLSEIVISSYAYHFTEKMHLDFPKAKEKLSNGHAYDLKSNTFEKLPEILLDEKPNDGCDYVQVIGREKVVGKNKKRNQKFIRADYITDVPNLHKYKIFLSSANANGVFGETLTPPFVVEPGVASTETFLSLGIFDKKAYAENLKKYIHCKFSRALLGIVKATHHVTVDTWKYVPLQDFTPQSDIDWSKSIPEIDEQLYDKYGLSPEERDFIETHVKEME